PGGDFRTLPEEAFFKGGENEQDIFRLTVVAHQTDAPGLALEVAQAAADLDAELVEKLRTHGGVIHAAWHAHSVELRQLVSLGGRVGQAESEQAGLEGAVVLHVAF